MSEEQPLDLRKLAADQLDPELSETVTELLVDAVDLHCHSGPAAMPRILDHHEAMLDAEKAGFKAIVYKDHFYGGMAHAQILEKLFPDLKVRLFSGIALNNANGGINPHAVNHAIQLGAKIVWMPTLSAANHVKKTSTDAKNFPKTSGKTLPPIPLSVLDDSGKLTDEAKLVLDLIAEGDIILSGGHLHVTELTPLFEEAVARGVKKMMVNHPTYLIDAEESHIRQLTDLGVYMEHSISMFLENYRRKTTMFPPEEIVRLVKAGGVDKTLFCSDLGLQNAAYPVDGYRLFVQELLRLQFSRADIRKLISANGAKLLNLQ